MSVVPRLVDGIREVNPGYIEKLAGKDKKEFERKKVSLHCIKSVDAQINSFEIENGASFSLLDKQAAIQLELWRTQHQKIRILPHVKADSNNGGFHHRYFIQNELTGERVKAALLIRGPLRNCPYNHRIVEINSATGNLVIQHGKSVEDETDGVTKTYQVQQHPLVKVDDLIWHYRLERMQPNDEVIIGDNGTDFFLIDIHNDQLFFLK